MSLCLPQVCFGVCLYGLYHGLVFLPALLALIGPESHSSVTPTPYPNTPRTPSSSSKVFSLSSQEKNDKSESWEDDVVGVFTVEGQGGEQTQGI